MSTNKISCNSEETVPGKTVRACCMIVLIGPMFQLDDVSVCCEVWDWCKNQ